VCATYSVRVNFRQADVVKLSFLDHLIEHFRIVLDLVVRVGPRGLEQIEPLRPAQGFEDVIDTPAQVLPTPVGRELARDGPTLDGEERTVCVFGVPPKEARDQLEVRGGQALPVELA
jgi:hypothetical protein